jgi:hypothetical protein
VAARGKGLAIADGGHQCRRGNGTEARDAQQAPARFVLLGLLDQTGIQLGNPASRS